MTSIVPRERKGKLTGDGIDDAGRRRLHSHREVDSRGEKDIQRCYVSFTYVMIGTYTHAHTHTYTYTEGIGVKEGRRESERELWERHTYTRTWTAHMLV